MALTGLADMSNVPAGMIQPNRPSTPPNAEAEAEAEVGVEAAAVA